MDRVKQAADYGFDYLCQGVNFDVAFAVACGRYSIRRESAAFFAVRELMAQLLYEW